MPSSVNGFGTGLVRASRKRTVGEHTQFDAVEALMLAYLPVIPYKAIHVFSIWQAGYEKQGYRSVPLRITGRLVLKAFLNRWGDGLCLIGGGMLAIFGLIILTVDRPFNQTDADFLITLGAMLAAGIVCKLLWLAIGRKDERIKDAIGPHQFGSSDPLDWPHDTAQTMADSILRQESARSLVDVARRAMDAGESAKAMFCLRVAMHDKNNWEAQDLFRRALQSPAPASKPDSSRVP